MPKRGSRSTKKLSAVEKMGRGTLRRRREPLVPPKAILEPPVAPAWLNPVGKDYWRRLTEVLCARGQLTKEDMFSLEALCRSYEEWTRLREDIDKKGYWCQVKTVRQLNGKTRARMYQSTRPVVNPSVALFHQVDVRILNYLKEFGLTAASRSKIDLAKIDPNAKPEPEPMPLQPPVQNKEKMGKDPLTRYGFH